jgi:hypothetical protein
MELEKSEKAVRRLIDLANAAALDHRKWAWFLDELSRASGGVRVHMFSQVTTPCLGQDSESIGVQGFDTPSPAHGAARPSPANRPVALSDIASPGADGDWLNDRTGTFADGINMHGHVMGGPFAVLERSADRTTLIGGHIRQRDQPTLAPGFVALLEPLVPVLRHALDVARRLGGLALENRVLRDGMDPDLTAILALDQKMRVQWSNTRAERLLARGDPAWLGPSAQVRFSDPLAQAKLTRALHDQAQPEVHIAMPFVVRGSDRRQYLCRTTPISQSDGPLPWLAPISDDVTDFLVLCISPTAMQRAEFAHKKSRG